MFQFITNDPIICARYNYCKMKCVNYIWTKRKQPSWFEDIKKSILKNKNKLINKINTQVRDVLPSLIQKGDTVYRFHSFLRVSYDYLFQGKWNVKAKLMNKYDESKPLLYQLTYPQLYFLYKITKSLKNKKTLSLLNINSLKYRKKLKFPNNKINYYKNPEYYIPILMVRTHENKTDPMNQTLFHQFITNNFGQVEFFDEIMECILICPNNNYIIKFDKNSSSAFTEFKNQLSTLLNSKFETEFYPSGNTLYVGNVLHVKENEVLLKRQPNGFGVLYYDLPDHKMKYSGEFENGLPDGAGVFYDKTGKIKLTANNISNGVPTQKGKLEFNFKTNKQVFKIEFSKLWDDVNINDNTKALFATSDTFLDIVVENVYKSDEMPLKELHFNEKSVDEKLVEIKKQLELIKEENRIYHNNVKESNRFLCNILFGIGAGIFINMMAIMVLK